MRQKKFKKQMGSRFLGRQRLLWLRWLGLILALGAVVAMVWQWQHRVWDGRQRVNLVIATPVPGLLSYDPSKQRVFLVTFPDTLMIEAAGGYGKWRAGALVGLDRQEGKKGTLVMDSVSNFMGVMADGYVVRNQESGIRNQEYGKSEIVSWLNGAVVGKLTGRTWTNLTWWDILGLWWMISGLKAHEFTVVNLGETVALEADFLPDGSKIFESDLLRLSALSQKWFTDETLVQEGTRVLVVNTTGVVGLGGGLARMLTTMGMHVVGVEDGEEPLDTTWIEIGTHKARRLSSLVRLVKFLPGVKITEMSEIGGRAEMVVRLGADYQHRMKTN